MNAKAFLAASSMWILVLGLSQAHAYQIDQAPLASQTQQKEAASLSQALANLEQEIAQLEKEFTSPAEPGQQPAPVQPTNPPPPAVEYRTQPWSMQYRTITTVVTFDRIRVTTEDGLEIWYSKGYFFDATDGKTYQFLLNDMGAMAASRDPKMECVVVFRPADRQLTERDIASIIPIEWVHQQSQSTQPAPK